MVRLTEEDKLYLAELGYDAADCRQIESASACKMTVYKYKERRISQERAIELLGRADFLSGLARSAFHWSAVRETGDGELVMFDSSVFFRS